MRGAIIVALSILSLAACRGRDFERPAPESFTLGTTTQAEIEGKYGKPYQQNSVIRTDDGQASGYAPATPFGAALVPGSFTTLVYLHDNAALTVLYSGVPSEKSINFTFWSGTLVAYNYLSSFDEGSSDFDEKQINNLRKGQTTKAEVAQLLGPPTGRVVYPLIRDQGDEEFIYEYVQAGRSERHVKSLQILFGSDGTIRDVRFGTQTAPLPRR